MSDHAFTDKTLKDRAVRQAFEGNVNGARQTIGRMVDRKYLRDVWGAILCIHKDHGDVQGVKETIVSCSDKSLLSCHERGGSGNSDSVLSGSLASPKPPAGGEPKEHGDEENETQSRGHLQGSGGTAQPTGATSEYREFLLAFVRAGNVAGAIEIAKTMGSSGILSLLMIPLVLMNKGDFAGARGAVSHMMRMHIES